MADKNNKNENGYSGAYSSIKKLRYVVVALLVLFVIFAVFYYREDLTVENFRYLMKYVDVKPVTFGSDENTQIDFESDSATVTASFREDLVVLTKTSLKIYDLSSKEILSSTHGLTHPAIADGERYFAVYDMGARYVAVYNSFSKLWEETMEYPVYDVSMDSEGNFCIATGAKDHTSALKVYNNDFKNIFNWKTTDKYAVCADIHTDEKTYMAVGTLKSTEVGDMQSSLVMLSADSQSVLSTVDMGNEMVMDVAFNSKGNAVCLTDSALRTVTPSGTVQSLYPIDSQSLRRFGVGGRWTVLVLNRNLVGKDHSVIIFDESGNTYMDVTVSSEITDICVSDSFVFLLGVEDITVVDLGNKTKRTYDSDRSYRSVELLNEENVYLVYDGLALAVGVEGE